MFRLSNSGVSGYSRLFLILLLTIFAAFPAVAQSSKSSLKNTTRGTTSRAVTSDVIVGAFEAVAYSGATRITWRTTYEKNILGFRVWREDAGQRTLVDEQLVAGSLMQVGGGVLDVGGDYELLDDAGATNVYYWVEAIDISQKSRWFGPVYPSVNFDKFAGDEAGVKATSRRDATGVGQVDRLAADVKSSSFKAAPTEVAAAVNANGQLLASDASALKIEVRTKGIYRIEASTLVQNGFNPAQSANWRMFVAGAEQPIIVNSDGSVEFFGVGLNTIQTDTQVYWLVTDTVPGRRITRNSQTFVKNAGYAWSRIVAERRDSVYLVTSILNGTADNWYGGVVGPTAASQTLTLSDIATSSGATATITIDLQGLTYYSHQVSIRLNGVSLGNLNYLSTDAVQWSATVPLSMLVEGTNTITMQALAGSTDISVTEAIRISYPRANRARGDRVEFSLAPSSQPSLVKGFTNPNVRIFDVTDPASPIEIVTAARLDSGGSYMVSIAGAPTTRQFFAIAGSNMISRSPTITRNTASNLANAQNSANMVIIGPAEFRSTLEPLAAQRTAEGIQTTVVDIEDIYDEFGNGVRSAEAIRAFFQYAKQNWTVKPDFAILAGDSSIDPRNYAGTGGPGINRVPAFFVDTWNMETVSDEMLADFNHDGVGEIALGRLPAKDIAELQIMVGKILGATPLTMAEVQSRGSQFVSDALIGYDFEAGSRNMASSFPTGSNVNFVDAAGRDVVQLRADIVNRINGGPAVVNYFGHGSVAIWANTQFFRTTEAQTLYSPVRVSFFSMIDCMNGYYAGPITSLAESVIRQPNGGANAVWASSGWNSAYDQEYFARDFYQKVFTGMALGEAARQTKLLYGNTDMRVSYIFFGDPSQPLIR